MDENSNRSIPADPSGKKEIIDWIKTIVFAVIVGLVLRIFVFQVVGVEQSSMYPTLVEGQNLFIYKLAYTFSEPKRGDIVIVKISETQNYVKRVIALAGETVEIKDNTVYIDGEKLEEDYLVDGLRYDDYAAVCVPEGCIFVMGDNRPYSLDSRSSSVGFIRDENIVGRVLCRLRPFTVFSR
jgi:signal peptidase I